MNEFVWSNLTDEAILGRDLLEESGAMLYRGPIRSVAFDGPLVVIDRDWCAESWDWGTTWKIFNNGLVKLNTNSPHVTLEKDKAGRIVISLLPLSTWTILPRGENLAEPTS